MFGSIQNLKQLKFTTYFLIMLVEIECKRYSSTKNIYVWLYNTHFSIIVGSSLPPSNGDKVLVTTQYIRT